MNEHDRPYGSDAGTSWSGNVSFGAQEPAPVATADLIADTTTQGFSADVIQESRKQPVLVDFWAPWCGPCKQLTPTLEKAVREAGGRVKLVKMNIDEHPAIAGQLGIQSIPAVIAFRDGQPVDGFMGAVPERQVKEFIERLAGPDQTETAIEEALAAAAAAAAEGDGATAREIYSQVLSVKPESVEAIAGLAGLLANEGDLDGAAQMLAKVPADKAETPAVRAVAAKLDLAKQATALGDSVDLERRIAADPKDFDARFDLAMVQNGRGQRAEAADGLLAIMKADRTWRDDGARKQLLQFFESWGATDEATLTARRKLSSLLFA